MGLKSPQIDAIFVLVYAFITQENDKELARDEEIDQPEDIQPTLGLGNRWGVDKEDNSGE